MSYYNPYDKITDTSHNIKKYAPLISKIIRGNQAPLMNKELRQAIIENARLLNRHLKYPPTEKLHFIS